MELVLSTPGIWADLDLSNAPDAATLVSREIAELWDDLDDPEAVRASLEDWVVVAAAAGEARVAVRIDDGELSDVIVTESRFAVDARSSLGEAFASVTGGEASAFIEVLGGRPSVRRTTEEGAARPLVEFWTLDPGGPELVCIQFTGASADEIEDLCRTAMSGGGWFDSATETALEIDDPVGLAPYDLEEN